MKTFVSALALAAVVSNNYNHATLLHKCERLRVANSLVSLLVKR
jgi:hypothetical protein